MIITGLYVVQAPFVVVVHESINSASINVFKDSIPDVVRSLFNLRVMNSPDVSFFKFVSYTHNLFFFSIHPVSETFLVNEINWIIMIETLNEWVNNRVVCSSPENIIIHVFGLIHILANFNWFKPVAHWAVFLNGLDSSVGRNDANSGKHSKFHIKY